MWTLFGPWLEHVNWEKKKIYGILYTDRLFDNIRGFILGCTLWYFSFVFLKSLYFLEIQWNIYFWNRTISDFQDNQE